MPLKCAITAEKSRPLCTNSVIYLHPESTRLITEIEATVVQLKLKTYREWSVDLSNTLLLLLLLYLARQNNDMVIC